MGLDLRADAAPAVTVRSVLIALVVVCPFATFVMSFRDAMVVQAVLVTLLMLTVGAFSTVTTGRLPPLGRIPNLARAVAIVWTAVGLLGTIVALVRGNDLVLVIGQLLAWGLLPLGVVVGSAVPRSELWRDLTAGVAGGTAVGALVSMVAWLSGGVGPQGRALYLPNHISVSGVYLLAVLLWVAAVPEERSLQRRLSLAVLAILGFYLLVLGSRSLLLLTPLCFVLWALLAKGYRIFRLAAAVMVGAALAAGLGFAVVLVRGGEAVFPQRSLDLRAIAGDPSPAVVSLPFSSGAARIENRSGEQVVLSSSPVDLDREGAFRLRAEIRGSGSGWGYVGVRWLDQRGRILGIARAVAKASGHWQKVDKFVKSPDGAAAVQLIIGTKNDSHGVWLFRRPSMTRVGGAQLASIHHHWSLLANRYGRLAEAVTQPTTVTFPSLEFRLQEMRTVWSHVERASVSSLLFGHGLGATFEFRLGSFNNVMTGPGDVLQNYIHNYYLYLLFKVGLIGLGATLVIAMCLAWQLGATCLHLPVGVQRGRIAAVVVAWAGYLAWAVVAPELVDFRVAPLWGLAIVAASAERSAANGGRPDGRV